jgi:hypothetical protein
MTAILVLGFGIAANTAMILIPASNREWMRKEWLIVAAVGINSERGARREPRLPSRMIRREGGFSESAI